MMFSVNANFVFIINTRFRNSLGSIAPTPLGLCKFLSPPLFRISASPLSRTMASSSATLYTSTAPVSAQGRTLWSDIDSEGEAEIDINETVAHPGAETLPLSTIAVDFPHHTRGRSRVG